MISDEKRREVAERLRDEIGYMRELRAWYEEDSDVVERGNAAYRNIAHSVIPGGEYGNDYIGMVNRLADLIDRPTCELVEVWDDERMEHYLDCTACHFGRLAIKQDDEGKRFNSRALWTSVDYTALTHCPYCGAEVVR